MADGNVYYTCNDATDPDVPDCAKIADEKYTMDFADIGEGCIYWCSVCGPRAHSINDSLMRRMAHEPGFADRFEEALNQQDLMRSIDKDKTHDGN